MRRKRVNAKLIFFQVIRNVNPDSIMVELDDERARKLREGQKFTYIEGIDSAMEKMTNIPGLGSMFAKIMKNVGTKQIKNLLKILSLESGVEFKAAMEEAEKKGITVVNGDIHINVNDV